MSQMLGQRNTFFLWPPGFHDLAVEHITLTTRLFLTLYLLKKIIGYFISQGQEVCTRSIIVAGGTHLYHDLHLLN